MTWAPFSNLSFWLFGLAPSILGLQELNLPGQVFYQLAASIYGGASRLSGTVRTFIVGSRHQRYSVQKIFSLEWECEWQQKGNLFWKIALDRKEKFTTTRPCGCGDGWGVWRGVSQSDSSSVTFLQAPRWLCLPPSSSPNTTSEPPFLPRNPDSISL